MKVADFDYFLPADLIAKRPKDERDSSRLFEINGYGGIHRDFSDFPELLQAGDLLVLNDTKVIKARLRAQKDTGGMAEILIEEITGVDQALCQVRVSKPLKMGRLLILGDLEIKVLDRKNQFYQLQFPAPVHRILERFGEVPLPPYIGRSADSSDESRYQTIYGVNPGAVAAPTAGLHFTENILDAVRRVGVNVLFITLHIGSGTFQPIRVKDISMHRMHEERYTIPQQVADQINHREGRVVAVGTTVVRALESATHDGVVRATSGVTNIFIKPGYNFQVVDALLTNFHLPRSTLLMLVCALGGYERVMDAYRIAVGEEYRFFSYGDACFLRRRE